MNKFGTHHWRKQESGIRYELRQPPLFMRMNMWEGKCWCGRPKELWARFQRKYCCYDHSQLWFYSIRAYWDGFRMQVIRRDKFTCQECGFKTKTDDSKFDVDHIIAISLGGMCYDLGNVRTLCRDCHHKKTSQDMKHLKRERRKLQSLEVFIK